jgi:hypothetical protein
MLALGHLIHWFIFIARLLISIVKTLKYRLDTHFAAIFLIIASQNFIGCHSVEIARPSAKKNALKSFEPEHITWVEVKPGEILKGENDNYLTPKSC